MSHFVDILFARMPDALRVILRVAFYFSLLVMFLPRMAPRVFHAVESLFSRLAERKTLAVVALFFIVIGVRLAVLPQLPVPVPGIHDEYSYFLIADTLAHGRLANPTHPMWMSFESFHVNWFPTYSSKDSKLIDRKSTRLNSSHANISYAVFCLKKKKKNSNVTL